MTLHRNARTCPGSRKLLVDRVVLDGWSIRDAAEAAGISQRSACKWLKRFREEGEAGLERVRGETAALRNLANAGRMVEDNPGLLQLRMLQQLGGSSGNTVMLSMPDGQGSAGSTPLPPTRARYATSQRARSGSEPPSSS